MKYLGWLFLFALSSVHSQEVIESIPLSVEDDGARKIIVKEELGQEKAKSEGPATPVDGQLKLEPTSAPIVDLNGPEVSKKETLPTSSESPYVDVSFYDKIPTRYLQFSFGYLNSRYKKINSSLQNGSVLSSFRFAGDINPFAQTGFAVEIISDTTKQTIPDNIRALQYRLFADYHRPFYESTFRLDWLVSLALSIGDYGIKRRYLNAQGQEVSQSLKKGMLVGLIPAGGLRVYLVDKNSIDFIVEYHQYFGKPQSYIGGLAFSPRLSFEF